MNTIVRYTVPIIGFSLLFGLILLFSDDSLSALLFYFFSREKVCRSPSAYHGTRRRHAADMLRIVAPYTKQAYHLS